MEDRKRQNKKKKRSFIQNAKKFAWQGKRGRGTDIDQDQYDYLVRVMQRWRDPFENEDEKTIFVRNVFQQIEDNERLFSGNQLASRVIELLLPHADVSVLQKFIKEMSDDIRKLCTDQFCSHVLEKIMLLCAFKKQDTQISYLETWIIKISKFMCNNFAEFSANPYASHLLRTCIQCITGIRNDADAKSNKTEGYDALQDYQFTGNEDLDECQDILKDRIIQVDPESFDNELTSAVTQCYLKIFKLAGKKDRLKSVIKHLLESIYFQNPDFENPSIVRLLESIIQSCSIFPKVFNKMNSLLFVGKLESFARHQSCNFLVQKYFDSVPTDEMFTSGYDELSGCIEILLEEGYTGVVLSIAKACVRLKCQQSGFLQSFAKALHCNSDLDEIAIACIKLYPADKLQDDMPVHLHGSLILQHLFSFNKPIQVVKSLLSLESANLRKIFSDPKGSHIVNSFVSSTSVGEKSRDGLVKQLCGEYVSLSCSKHGSWAVQKLWDNVNIRSKQMIVQDLAEGEKILRSDQFGHFVYTSCAVSVFVHQKSEWSKVISKEEKEKSLFKDIIGDDSTSVKKRKNEEVSTEAVNEENKGTNDKEEKDKNDESSNVESEAVPKKKKKKKEKSYLDDL